MSLRIAILGTRGIPNCYGGFEQLTEHLAPGLVQAGHAVTVYNSHNHPYRNDEWKGVRIRHCYDPEYLLGSAGQFIYDLNCLMDARKEKYDVILQLGYTSSSVWGFLFPRESAVIYNLDGLEWKRTKYSLLARRFLLYAEKLAVRFSHFTIADSRIIQSYFRYKHGIGSEYIPYGAVAPTGTDMQTLSEFGVSPDNYFLLIARMEPENNVEMILEGFCMSNSGKKFLVIGNTVNQYGRRLVHKFRHNDRIIFTGGIFDSGKLHDLKSASCLYFHGHSTGGTNPSLLEAMASRAMIAAHDNAFNREVLEQNALYFSSVSDIAGIIESFNRGPREETMIRNNFQVILRKYNWPMIIERYERFIVDCAVRFKQKLSVAAFSPGQLHASPESPSVPLQPKKTVWIR